MGRGIIESGLFRSEQYGVEQRTSDPSDHQEGERWIRTDLAPEADQIATYRFDMGSEVVDIPIYDTNATTENVEKVRRVQVDGELGFIPFAESGAAYPQWAMQHAGTRLGAHDALTAFAIPDSVVDNYEASLYGDQDKTLSDYYEGDLGDFNRQQTTVLEGSWTLESPNNPGSYIASTGELPRYPQKGDEFSVLVRPGTDAAAESHFATPSNTSSNDLGYGARLETYQTGNLAIVKRSGVYSELASVEAGLSAGTDYEAVFEWHDGSGSEPDNTIVVSVYNYDTSSQERGSLVDSVSASDSELVGNEGIAYTEGSGNNPTNYWDKYRYLGDVS